MKPWLLDLFSGAGGCAKGYQRAGFYVIGVDIEPQPNYRGDELITADALGALAAVDEAWALLNIAAVHASPPCQFATDYRRRPGHVKESPNLIPATRVALMRTGLPYVIENVERARHELFEPEMLCGSSFGLDVRRHRLFETNFPLPRVPCAHGWQTPRFPPATNRTNLRSTVEVGVWRIPLDVQKRAMGVDWDVTLEELSQMVPPAYTEEIGSSLMAEVERRAKVAA